MEFSEQDVAKIIDMVLRTTGEAPFDGQMQAFSERLQVLVPFDTLAIFPIPPAPGPVPGSSATNSLVYFSPELVQRRSVIDLDYSDFAQHDPKAAAVRMPWCATSLTHYQAASEFDRSPYTGEFLTAYGLRFEAGISIPVADAGLVAIGLHRSRPRGDFSGQEIALLRLVAPALSLCFRNTLVRRQLRRGLAQKKPQTTEVLAATLIFDRWGRLDFADPEALQLLEGEALELLASDARQLARAAPLAPPLERRLPLSNGGAVCARIVRFEQGRQDLKLVCGLARIPRRAFDNFASEAERHGLTSRQREVARCAIRGLSNSEIARQLSISVSTVKHHLAAVLQKTGLHSRTELAGLLLGGLGPGWWHTDLSCEGEFGEA